MTFLPQSTLLILTLLLPRPALADGYTRVEPVGLKVIGSATPFPGPYGPDNLLQPAPPKGDHPEFASHAQAERTFVDFDLGSDRTIVLFRHVQRVTPDVVATAELVFSKTPDFATDVVARIPITHVTERGATTTAPIPPTTARYVRWQVKSLVPRSSPNVGGQSIELIAAATGPKDPAPTGLALTARPLSIVRKTDAGPVQPIELSLTSPYLEPVSVDVSIDGRPAQPIDVSFGTRTVTVDVPPATEARKLAIALSASGATVASQTLDQPAFRPLTVYLLPHSHTDIGYTALQPLIEEKQLANLRQGIAAAQKTAAYPEGARFVWNLEGTWAARMFLDRMPEAEKSRFLDAVKSGQVAINGMYLNELTGLCRPEELIRLFREKGRLEDLTGQPIDSAMISDVSGYTWGTVPALQQAGIRYFSVAPNYFDRIGRTMTEWENRPFWWVGPDGSSRVLVWIPFQGYATSHLYRTMSPKLVADLLDDLAARKYPYSIAYLRWSGLGDNATPDPSICDFVRDWNAVHESPRFVIASTSEAFRAFEARHGAELPVVQGDWTPYWEDGAGSSAVETALNRNSSDRLAQAETLWALRDPARYPASRFDAAWQNVLLYSEHTWGAHCSISQPLVPFTTDQWEIKRAFAATANTQSRQLLSDAAAAGPGLAGEPSPAQAVDVFNTSSWPRTEVVLIPRELSSAGDRAADDQGHPVPTQRLSTDELALLVTDLPPFSGRRYTIRADGPAAEVQSPAHAADTTITSGRLTARLDPASGDVVDLQLNGLETNLVNPAAGQALNSYLYLPGDNLSAVAHSGPATIRVVDGGPLVAALRVESPAPGTHGLVREVRLTAGSDSLELRNTVDKARLVAASYHAAEGKESVNFAFPFAVPGGATRYEVPFAVARAETDQIPGACRNWITVNRWADVANTDFGVTWTTLDAPLVQLGGLTATLLNSQHDPNVWLDHLPPTQTLVSWVMNNHWGTNYRAFQEGPVLFRYLVRPHVGSESDAAITRSSVAASQPLVVAAGRGEPPRAEPLLTVDAANVVVTALKPSDDGQALILRIHNLSPSPEAVRLTWPGRPDPSLCLSQTSEHAGQSVEPGSPLTLAPRSLTTLRASWPAP
jgi:hypothetical protein